jgi:uncharacterized protein
MRLRFYFVLFFSVLTTSFVVGQNVPVSIQVLSKTKANGIWLRWAPANASVWSLGNKYGYKVERFTLQPDGTLENPQGEVLTPLIKPITEQAFDQLASEVEEAAVVQEMIYGENSKKSFDPVGRASILSRNREMENEFGIALLMCDLSRRVAQAAGLFWEDNSAQKGKRYIYRISVNFKPTNGSIEPGVVVVDVKEEVPLAKINDLVAQFGDHKATLQWSTVLHRGMYSAYYIEKSSDGQKFARVSDLPYVHLSQSVNSENAFYVDSLAVNNQSFSYRIQGISPFAEEGPVSNTVSGSGKDNLSGLLVIREGKSVPPKSTSIKWEFPPEAEKQIAGFKIGRSNIAEGPYKDVNSVLIQKNVRDFSDETSFYNTYYVVRAVDTQGREVSRSFPYLVQIEDTTPPAIPLGLKGEVDKNGLVRLSWNANTDADLLGYRVFQANTMAEEFTEVTKDILVTPLFVDSLKLKVLNKDVFFKIVAVDKNFNPSEYTSPVKLKRPDIVPPVPPVFTSADVQDGKVVLKWDNAANDDAATMELVRIEKEDKTTRTISSWKAPVFGSSYMEPFLTLGKTYRYKLTLTDSAGNKSETLSGEIFYETGVRKPVQGLQSAIDREKKSITLSWKNEGQATKCFVYRKKNGGAITLYQTLEGNITSFTDRGMTANNTYTYQVQVVFPKGIKSLISEEHVVKY